MRHEMKLRSQPFLAIAEGRKIYELRLYDEKRQRLAVGDEIRFTCVETKEQILRKVVGLHRFSDFRQLYHSLPLLQCGYREEDVCRARPEDMEQYYTPEEQALWGVVAIELGREDS